MKLTVSQFRDGALVLSCGDGGAEVDLVFAAGAMHGDPRLDDQRAILDAIVRLHAENERLRAALQALLARDEQQTCQHDTTFRGGAIWEICEDCGARWADDRGGKPEWTDPPEWIAARTALKEPT